MLESELGECGWLLHGSADNAGLSDDEPARTANARGRSILMELSVHNIFPAADDLAAPEHTLWTNRERRSWRQCDGASLKRTLNFDLRFFAELQGGVAQAVSFAEETLGLI